MLLQANPLYPAIAEPAPEDQQQAASYDATFVQRLKDRDVQAFDQLVLEQGPHVRRVVSRLLGWNNDCDDVVQDVFVVVWQSIGKFREDANLATWLYSIAVNQCRKRRRDHGIWNLRFGKYRRDRENRERERIRTHESESKPALGKPTTKQIYEALNQLSHRDRESIVLCSLEGKTMDQAATLLGIRINALEVRLHRARKRLKNMLDAIGKTRE